jgi:hypothetical protein
MRAAVIVAVLALVLNGCAKPLPPPVAPPPPLLISPAEVNVRHLPAPTPGGKACTQPSADPALALRLGVEIVGLEQTPSLQSKPVDSEARLIVQTRDGAPILTTARLTRRVAYFDSDQSAADLQNLVRNPDKRSLEILNIIDALPAGVIAEYEIGQKAPGGAGAQPSATQSSIRPKLTVQLRRVAADDNAGIPATELSLTIADPEGGATASGEPAQTETAFFDIPEGAAAERAMLVPFAVEGYPNWGVTILVKLTPGGDVPNKNDHRQLLDAVLAEVKAAAANPSAGPTTVPSAQDQTLAAAIGRIREFSGGKPAADERPSLVFLCDQSGAEFCMEVAMVADADQVHSLCQKLAADLSVGSIDRTSAGWLLDRDALLFLSELQKGSKMPDELLAVVTTYAGEAGRHEATMEGILNGLASRADLQVRLTAENLIFLEDSSPASRARAFEWLSTHGQPIKGYNPLGPIRERRAAIDKALNSDVGGAP